MTDKEREEDLRESGLPGGGAGRKDEIGKSGVYPASGPFPEGNAEYRGQMSWGQGERGAAGYEDHGESELNLRNGQLLGGYKPEEHFVSTLSVEVPAEKVTLRGELAVPEKPRGAVLFAHGSGSSRLSPRNQYVAGVLQQAGLATLLLDLLTEQEEAVDWNTAELRFDIGLLTRRLRSAAMWLVRQRGMDTVKLGCFGASTGAAAALALAAEMREIAAVVSRGGRIDLAEAALGRVNATVLLIVGGLDTTVLELNRAAMTRLAGEKKLEVVPAATHLFEEPGALEQVAQLARGWFEQHLASRAMLTDAA